MTVLDGILEELVVINMSNHTIRFFNLFGLIIQKLINARHAMQLIICP